MAKLPTARWPRAIAGFTLMACCDGSPVTAQQPVQPVAHSQPADQPTFVMVNTILNPNGKTLAKHRIVFTADHVYDFSESDDRFVTIFRDDRIDLLDRQSRVRTKVPRGQLSNLAAQAESMLISQEQAANYGVAAELQQSANGNRLTATYGNVRYQTSAERSDPATAARYSQFVIAASRLNLIRGLGTPPFVRIKMHDHWGNSARLPTETTMTVNVDNSEQTVRVQHQRQPISDADQKRIDEALGMLAVYPEVPLREFARPK